MMPDQKILLELLIYDPLTGKLFWQYRAEHYFSTVRAYRVWNKRYAHKEAFTSCDKKGYTVGAIFNCSLKAHRVIWTMCHGDNPSQIDHIDGNKNNNRLCNLRSVDNMTNHQNMPLQRNNKSGCPGIDWLTREKRWRARINANGHTITIGYFDNLSEAIQLRKAFEIICGFHNNHGRGNGA